MRDWIIPALCALVLMATCTMARAKDNNPFSGAVWIEVTMALVTQEGTASWYGYESGTDTASGRKFNPKEMTCAMRRRDWGTKLTVTVIATGISAECTLTDFGPAKKTRRLIDVSEGMAKKLGFHKAGLARVRVE